MICLIFITCSCAKSETIMKINKDKSVNLTVNIGYMIDSNKALTIDEVKQKVGSSGYYIDSYYDDKYSGYSISKKYKNINDISSKSDITVNLADIINGNFDDSKLFKVKKGFFKNIYTASYTYDFRNIYNYKIYIYLFGEESNQDSIELSDFINDHIDNENIELIKYNVLTNVDNFYKLKEVLNNKMIEYDKIPVVVINDSVYVGNTLENRNLIIESISSLTSSEYKDLVNPENSINNDYEITYKVSLPFKVLSNNATEVDGNTLIWRGNYFSSNNIEFSFSVYKTSSIIILIVFILSILIVIMVIFIIYEKNKNDRNRFIEKNSDISNITPEFNNEINKIMSVNDLMK